MSDTDDLKGRLSAVLMEISDIMKAHILGELTLAKRLIKAKDT